MQAIGEVLSSTITGFTAEAWVHEDGARQPASPIPAFGSFIRSYSEEKKLSVFAVVYNIITGPIDQHYKPMALRMTRAELKREQPQIFSLLKTELHTVIIGYRQHKAQCMRGLPPFPPEVHDFIYTVSDEELLDLSENLEYLRMLQAVPGVPVDELLAATIRSSAKVQRDEYKYLIAAGQQISRLFRDDYDRLGSILNKIRP